MSPRNRIVLLGSMTKMPVAGVVWQVLHYLVGFERLGYEAYYVEAHARTPSMLMSKPSDDATELAAGFIHRQLSRFGFGNRWAFHALHDDGSCHGMSRTELEALYADAAALINLHGGTAPREELARTGRLVYLETDPVQLQLEIAAGEPGTLDFLDCHSAFFTFASNYGLEECLLPRTERYHFIPTRQPVVLDFWPDTPVSGARFTTIGNWKQLWRPVEFEGEVLTWSKHQEFERVRTLPRRVDATFELALSSIDQQEIEGLESDGWLVRNGMDISGNIDDYRSFIASSSGEFTVAKEQNVRLRTGWFSDRSATYLASARPVVTQDTGYHHSLPVGEGLVPFTTAEEAVEAVSRVRSDLPRHSRAARNIAREHFSSDVVLPPLLDAIGLPVAARRGTRPAPRPGDLPADLDLQPVRKHPTVLAEAALEYLQHRPVTPLGRPSRPERPMVSVVVVTHDNLAFLRLCLESILLAEVSASFELIVVDNGSSDGTGEYLDLLRQHNPRVRPVRAELNLGFAGGVNFGAAQAEGDHLVFVNDDVLVGAGWIDRLCRHLTSGSIGMVGPVTVSSTRADRPTAYRTLGEYLELAASHTREGEGYEVPFLAMFCVALRNETYELIGPLDEGFGLGLFEDDDYCHRLRMAGFRLWCDESVLLHHFGEISLGKLKASGAYGDLFERNRARFEEKWGLEWSPPARPERPSDREYACRLRSALSGSIPTGSTALVVSRGDGRLVDIPGVTALHFPQSPDGGYAGHYPEHGVAAEEAVRKSKALGAEYLVVPCHSMWWLTFYPELSRYLSTSARVVLDDAELVKVFSLTEGLE